jgi:hypothetical protein
VQVFFVRGAIPAGSEELPELIPASFVKKSRAYLLDPEPGTYSLVAVTSDLAPIWNRHPVAGGVTRTVSSAELGQVVPFPAELIQRTKIVVGSGDVTFMGALQVRRSDRINANAVLQDDLQKGIAERIRPGVTSRSGLAGWVSTTWMVDLEETSISTEAADRNAFFEGALADLGDSPWAQVIVRAEPPEVPAARTKIPAPDPTAATPSEKAATPDSNATPPRPNAPPPLPTPEPEAAKANVPAPPSLPAPEVSKPENAEPVSQPATREPTESPPEPERRIVAGIPPDSPLAQIEIEMHHGKVRRILGDPDDRVERLTRKSWIPFYNGPGARLIDWVYEGMGRVVFSPHTGTLRVYDVVYDPNPAK